jgi:hypothetical protein
MMKKCIAPPELPVVDFIPHAAYNVGCAEGGKGLLREHGDYTYPFMAIGRTTFAWSSTIALHNRRVPR